MKQKNILLLILSLAIFISCNKSNKSIIEKNKVIHGIDVANYEANDYNIINLKENSRNSVWVAVNKDITVPQITELAYFTYKEYKTNLKIEELNMIIDTLYFADKFSTNPTDFNLDSNLTIEITQDMITPVTGKEDLLIKKNKDEISVADIYSKKKEYEGKKITITGIVTKYNPDIMGTNWIHIQDGSSFDNFFDLTINSDLEVKVGDTITASGTIELDKDLGYGYFYPVILTDASIK